MSISTDMYIFFERPLHALDVSEALDQLFNLEVSTYEQLAIKSGYVFLPNNRQMYVFVDAWNVSMSTNIPDHEVQGCTKVYFNLGCNLEAVIIMNQIAQCCLSKFKCRCFLLENDSFGDYIEIFLEEV